MIGSAAPVGNPRHSFYWASPTASPVQLQDFAAGDNTTALGLNSNGQIVGTRDNGNLTYQPIYWSLPTAAPVAMAVPGFTNVCKPTSINDSGVIVGWGFLTNATVEQSALYWASPSAQPVQLNVDFSSPNSLMQAYTVSNTGVVFGSVQTSGLNPIYCIWQTPSQNGAQLAIPSGDIAYSFSGSQAMGVDGTIVGWSGVVPNLHPIKYAPGSTTPTLLPTSTALPNWTPGTVSANGDILGTYQSSSATLGVILHGTTLEGMLQAVTGSSKYSVIYPTL